MLWPENFKKYDLLCWKEGEFFFFLGLVVWSWRELGRWRRWNMGVENRQSGHILTFVDEFTDRVILFVSPLAILIVNRHVTVRSYRFESLSDSVDISNGELVTSPYEAAVLNFLMISSVKSPAKTSTSANCLFVFNSEYSVHHSVGNYQPNVLVGIY